MSEDSKTSSIQKVVPARCAKRTAAATARTPRSAVRKLPLRGNRGDRTTGRGGGFSDPPANARPEDSRRSERHDRRAPGFVPPVRRVFDRAEDFEPRGEGLRDERVEREEAAERESVR